MLAGVGHVACWTQAPCPHLNHNVRPIKKTHVLLWRPVGLEELILLFEASMAVFPPRLSEQPIFYPVLNFEYAKQIAREWNTKSGSFAGYVTRFEVQDEYIGQFERRIVGGREHEELWVPADRLNEFNSHLEGTVLVEAAYFGPGFQGCVPSQFGLRGRNADEQLTALVGTLEYSGMDFHGEINANSTAIFVNYPYWQCCDIDCLGLSEQQRTTTCDAIEKVWMQTDRPATLTRRASRLTMGWS